MPFLIIYFASILISLGFVFPLTARASSGGSMCEALPKIKDLSERRCQNFTQFKDKEVVKAKAACVQFYEGVKKSAESLCEYSQDAQKFDEESADLVEAAGDDQLKLTEIRRRVIGRSVSFHRKWSSHFASGARRNLEGANDRYKKALVKLNDFGLEMLRQEATACGKPNSAPSPAYIGLALTAAYESAYTHKYMTEIFNSLAVSMTEQAEKDQSVSGGVDGLNNIPGGKNKPRLPRGEEPAHNPMEPGIKVMIMEAISHILKLHGLSSLGVDLADKLLITKRLDTLDLVLLSVKAMVITAGGTSAGPTVGISIGIALSVNGAIDYLEYGIRFLSDSFEKLANSRMDEFLMYYDCKVRKNQALGSSELAKSYHQHRRDGLCGAQCAQMGNFGICRPSLVFHADQCQ